MGSAKELKELTHAKLAAHVEDADHVSGKKPMHKPKNILFRAVTSFIKPEPVEVDITLRDCDKISGLTVFHTPGHTPGSIALLDEEKYVLFALDPAMERVSVRRIATLTFDVMLPGHGEPMKPDASEAIKKFAKTLT
jgi:glyoxylase-like metal-dependent hydrolase (beta-lactamase superfamily II)